MSKLNKLVFFGNERLATGLDSTKVPTLRALVGAGYEVAAVLSSYSEGRSRSARALEIAEVAKAHNIPVLTPGSLADVSAELKSYGAEAAVLVAYGQIIPESIIDIFPKGIINIHPSLLPKYRGPTPIETAILDGTPETGVSLMRLGKGMDTGPVFAQKSFKLAGDETKPALANSLLNLGSEMLLDHLPAILEGWLTPKPQEDSLASYSKLLTKADGWIDFSQPAEVYERQVRAFAGFPKSRAKLHGHEIVITKARVAQSVDDGLLVVACKPGFLEIIELTAPSGRSISGADFLRGYSKR